MNIEYRRLKSYNKCRDISDSLKSELALYGLYFVGPVDIVKCFSCGIECSFKIIHHDKVANLHLKISPNCKFMLQLDNTNCAVDNTRLRLPQVSYDECGFGLGYEFRQTKTRLGTFQNFDNSMATELAEAGFVYDSIKRIVKCWSCGVELRDYNTCEPWSYHASYSKQCKLIEDLIQTPQGRLRTYKNWKFAAISAKEMANAGLVYTNIDDVVGCSVCGILLSNWDNEDDPLLEHISHTEKCEFVLDLMKTIDGRLRSFKNWDGNQDKNTLAMAGFFYTGHRDEVETACCGIRMEGWDRLHAAMEIHKKLKPDCFVLSFFPQIPNKNSDKLYNDCIYYERYTGCFVCKECQFCAKTILDFIHDKTCKFSK